MIRELKDNHTYAGVMIILSLLTFIAGLSYGIIGLLSIPISSALSAALFIFEKPQKRFLSYLIPPLPIILLVLIYDISKLTSVIYIIIGVILALSYRFSVSKAKTAVYLSLTVGIYVCFSLYLFSALSQGNFTFEAFAEFYRDLCTDIKTKLIEIFKEAYEANNQQSASVMTPDLLSQYIDQYFKMLIAFIGIISFAIAGITIKLFTFTVLKLCKNGILKTFVRFFPSNPVAYVYIVFSILTIFIGLDSSLNIAIRSVSEILMFVFAYIGIGYLLVLAKVSERRTFIHLMIIGGFLLLPGAAIQILSYFGSWIVISTNHIIPAE